MLSRNVVDTSWLYALFDEDDAHHDRALKRSKKAGIYEVPSEILGETLALRYTRATQDKANAASTLLDQIINAGFHILGLEDPTPALAMYRHKPSLSYPDCVAVIQAHGAELLSFDSQQLKTWRMQRKS